MWLECREALESFTPRQLRLMMCLQPWQNTLIYSNQSLVRIINMGSTFSHARLHHIALCHQWQMSHLHSQILSRSGQQLSTSSALQCSTSPKPPSQEQICPLHSSMSKTTTQCSM